MSAPSPSPAPTAALPAPALDAPPRPVPEAGPARWGELEALGERIARLAAHISAATYRLLTLIAAFDAAGGWQEAGFRSCARWLAWRTGTGPGAAREKVRVARALGELPVLSEALRTGRISYSMARAITRVATPEDEAELVELARHATVAEVERLVRHWRASERSAAEALAAERRRHADRRLTLVPTEAGDWRISGRLDPEAGALLREALAAAEEQLHRRAPADGTDDAADSGDGADADHELPDPAARRADAIGRVAEAALGGGLGAEAEGRAGRFEVVVHVDAATLAGEEEAGNREAGEGVSAETPHIAGGPALPAETARRLACDAGLVGMVHGAGGETLDVGRRTRSVPAALRRALAHRDRRCTFPGCGVRVCDAHHLTPWAEGGPTSLDNLLLLCRRHHRLVHEGGWRVERIDADAEAGASDAGGPGPGDGAMGPATVRFRRPDGRTLPRVPPRPAVPDAPVRALAHRQRDLGIDGDTATPRTDRHGLDLDWALYTLLPPLTWEEAGDPDVSAETGPGAGG